MPIMATMALADRTSCRNPARPTSRFWDEVLRRLLFCSSPPLLTFSDAGGRASTTRATTATIAIPRAKKRHRGDGSSPLGKSSGRKMPSNDTMGAKAHVPSHATPRPPGRVPGATEEGADRVLLSCRRQDPADGGGEEQPSDCVARLAGGHQGSDPGKHNGRDDACAGDAVNSAARAPAIDD